MSAQTASTTQAQHVMPRVAEADSKLSRICRGLLASLGCSALFFISAPTLAATAPTLGAAQSFAVLAASAVTNTGASVVTGDLGISPNTASSVTGFPPGIVNGTTHYADAVALSAQNDVTTAYNNLASQPCITTISADLGGTTLTPGVYCSGSSMGLTGTVTLDALGDPNAVFVFKMGSTLTTASNASVNVINGGQSCNVFWQVGSSATLGTGTALAGNILAMASVTLNTGAALSGRALARTGAVTMGSSAVSVCSLAAPPIPGPTPTPPSLGKAFNPATINAGGASTLTVTLTNPNVTTATLTAPLIDTLPSGMAVAATPSVATTCTGWVPVANAGDTSVTLPSGSIIPANSSCTLTVNVTATAGGAYINTLPAGALVTTNGNNAAPAVTTLTVIPPVPSPTLGKAFSPSTINAGGVSTLTVTLSNTHVADATLNAALTDTLPGGVVIAATPNAATTCTGSGAPVAIAGGSTVTLPAGRSIPAGSSCTLSVNVTSAAGGAYINTLPVGALVTNIGNNAAPVVSTLTVVPSPGPATPPVLGKTFSPSTINAGGVSTLTVTLSNPNVAVATLTASLADILPSGMVIAATPNVATTCTGAGSPVAVAGASTVTLPSGRSIPANSSCTLTVSVTAAAGGSYINTLPAGALVTSNGINAAPAIATLAVVPPGIIPLLGKAFSPFTINEGDVSTLTVTLSNPNAAAATLTASLIDTFPSGVVIAATPNAATTCTGAGAPVANAGGATVTLPTGRSIPANGSCTLTVNVTAAVGGSYINTLLAGALKTSNGNNVAPAVATLVVVPVGIVIPPVVTPPVVTPPVVTPVGTNNIPTLSEWAMILLGALLAITGFAAMRRQER